MATLVFTLMLGVQGFANPCDMACVDPCSACNQYSKSGDLFSGLKRLVNGVGVRGNSCDPCDAVVACNPCDVVTDCDPCGDVCGTPKFSLGGRLRNLFASHGCNPCDVVTDCNPCDVVTDCDPCGADNGCAPRGFSFRGLFNGFRFHSGCVSDCGPCDMVGNCGPCDVACSPCDALCSPCDAACNPCDDVCGDYCGPRGRLFDLPRFSLGKLFGGFRSVGCCDDNGCGPCDVVQPCDACCR